MINMTADGGTLKAVLEWIPSFGINFTAYVDGLGLLFALLITGIGSLVVLYSIYYLSKEREQLGPFYVYLLMFMGAMLGVVLVDNVIVLYLFWELTSISSFFAHRLLVQAGKIKIRRDEIDAYHHFRRSFHAWRLHSSLHDYGFILD